MKKSAVWGILGLVMIIVGCTQPVDSGGVNPPPPPAVTYVVGDTGPAGGKIFYENTNVAFGTWNYLEAAPADLPTKYVWGYGFTSVVTPKGIGSGKANTAEIIATHKNFFDTAAEAADAYEHGGYTDWFLPSKDELSEMYKQKDKIGWIDETTYRPYWVWSSSQNMTHSAWVLKFSKDGGLREGDKPELNSVRVVRSF